MNIVPMQWQALVINDMRRDGISRLPITFPVLDVLNHLSETEVFNAHVAAKAMARGAFKDVCINPLVSGPSKNDWPMFCHSMKDIVTAPHILETALNLYPLVQQYFDGESPLLYSMNAFWTQPVPPTVPKYADTHWWHIDGDDRQQLVVFFMGTDIPTKEDGAHLYQRGSHKHYPNPNDKLGYPFEQPPDSVVEVMTGKAGTVFLTDPRGMHMAPRPQSKPRMLAWARWGVSDPPVSYGWDKLSPVNKSLIGDRYPEDPVLRQAIHLVVQ